MKEKDLQNLLQQSKEKDWFDFKREMKIYQSDEKPVIQQRDELLKDILGLANGNSHNVRKTKYLIIGVDDEKFDENGTRILYNVDYKVPTRSELIKWLNSACAPSIVGIDCESLQFQGKNLFIITIPPTFDLLETTRDLDAKGRFHKHTVFMRQDEHTVIASVRDGITIQQRKNLYRLEISNPSSLWIGAITGGIVGFIIGEAKINFPDSATIPETVTKFFFMIIGLFFGSMIGWISKQWNETRYDFRYMTLQEKFISGFILVMFVLAYILFFR